ncbi:cation-translocating P-type ATPase [Natrarchaeobius chitinivorans]|uniref:Cation-translocating P-type ATPase n=2 Tax=Natrarchaeobius chitinivorans TaxID=1679083 RepID=A0A3N6MLD4_NATCH|nr:cation-translocating P-type ATPase [Natrarchaeobius chitinivorans]
MYSATCETFLESVAEGCDGVERAEASYVAEAVRVDHDPARISAADLEGALSRLGYTAYRREKADAEDEAAGGTRRAREMSGIRKRRSDDMLEIRYIAGIVFGTFLLVPYAAVFYPVYLASYSSRGVLAHYQNAFATLDGALFLPVLFVLTGIVLYLTGYPLLRGAYVGLTLRRPNTHLLATLTIVGAYAYGTISLALGRIDVYYDLTIVVAALVMAAVFAESTIKRRAVDRLSDLTFSQVDSALTLEAGGETRSVSTADLESGDRVLVREGARVPVDGVLLEGPCTVDEAIVTGESLPISKEPGQEIVGGSIVTNGSAVVDVGPEPTSRIDRLTETVWNVQSANHGVTRHAEVIAKRLAPLVLGVAIAAGGVRYWQGADATGVVTALLLAIVATSPWTLGFATPVSVAASVGQAVERGIVVFDETVFERLREVDVVVFDKTGTLTTGEMTVLEADAPEDLLEAAATLERRASHPVARAFASAFGSDESDAPIRGEERAVDDPTRADRRSGEAENQSGTGEPEPQSESVTIQDQSPVCDFRSHATGVEGTVDGERLLVGHPDLFRDRDWHLGSALEDRVGRAVADGRLPVVVGRDGRAEGVVVVGDEPRSNWAETVSKLDESGIDVVVLTGDTESASEEFTDHPGVEHAFAAVPPDGKTAAIRRLKADGRVAMVGDGTNDAPALAEADLGISLGGGTALASDAADIAIPDENLLAIERAFRLATAARGRLRQNLGLGLVYNALVIPIAVAGLLNPLFATAAASASAILVAANASRPLVDE